MICLQCCVLENVCGLCFIIFYIFILVHITLPCIRSRTTKQWLGHQWCYAYHSWRNRCLNYCCDWRPSTFVYSSHYLSSIRPAQFRKKERHTKYKISKNKSKTMIGNSLRVLGPCEVSPSFPRRRARSEFKPRQTRQLPRAVDLKGRLLSCKSY